MYEHLKVPQNTGMGLGDFFWFAAFSSFKSPDGIKGPTVPVSPAVPTLADLSNITGDHEFTVATDGFVKIACAPYKNSITAEAIGEVGSQKMDISLKVFVPGSYATLHGLASKINREGAIVLVKDADCPLNMVYQVGTSCNPAYATVSFGSGTTKDGQKGYDMTFNSPGNVIQLYGGEITEKTEE